MSNVIVMHNGTNGVKGPNQNAQHADAIIKNMRACVHAYNK